VIHPDTVLRFVDDRIGLGVFATRLIPAGTITWARDPLDQVLTPAQVGGLPPVTRAPLERYGYRDAAGNMVLCWDHARYMNHSCEPSCLVTAFAFEIAGRDIAAGEELTNDYASFTMIADEPFVCLCGSPRCRTRITTAAPAEWAARNGDRLQRALLRLAAVAQPLGGLVDPETLARSLASTGGPVLPARLPAPPGVPAAILVPAGALPEPLPIPAS
jgi:hypothetical protein